MERFPPIPYDRLDPRQRELVDSYRSGWRGQLQSKDGRLGGPMDVMLRAPELASRLSPVGDYFRSDSALPLRLIELLILVVAHAHSSEYEWAVHRPWAEKAGVDPSTADAIAAGVRPPHMPADEAALYDLAAELTRTGQVSDATYDAARALFDERQVVEAVVLCGYYGLIAMVLGVGRVAVPGR